jgi:hypothetical protein
MAKLENFKGNIELISGITPKNENDFSLVDAHYVQVDETDKRLDEKLQELAGAATTDKIFADTRFTELKSQVDTNATNISTNTNSIGTNKTNISSLETSLKSTDADLQTVKKAFKGITDWSQIAGQIDLSNLGGNYRLYYDTEEYFLYLYDINELPDNETFDPSNEDHENAIKSKVMIEGGGGGGSTTSSTIVLKRNDEKSTFSVKKGSSVPLSIDYETRDNQGQAMGLSATAKIYVNRVLQTTVEFKEGTNIIDVGEYIPNGTATVQISVSNILGAMSSLYYTITGVELSLSSSFSDSGWFESDARISVIPGGATTKILHCFIDGTETKTSIGSSNSATTVTIPMTGHTTKKVIIYLTSTLDDGTELQSNSLFYEVMFVDSTSKETLIRCNYDGSDLQQYTTYVFKYTVYDPNSTTTTLVKISVDGELKSTVAADRTEQSFSYKPTEAGEHTLVFEAGGTTKTLTFNVKAFADADHTRPITDSLGFELTPEGRTNNDTNRDVYSYNGYNVTFSDNFDWYNGGWLVDDDNVDYLCIKAGDTITIDYPLFGSDNDTKTSGKNFKVIFKAVNCKKFDAQVMSTIASMKATVTETTKDDAGKETTTTKEVVNKIGVELTAQNGTVYYGSYQGVEAPYVEDELLEFECNIQPTSEYKEIITYLSADPVSCRIYDTNASFGQTSYESKFVPITFGSPDCDVHLYRFKAYTRSLTMDETMQNFYGDALTAEETSERYKRNQILDDDGEVDYTKLSQLYPDMRIILITCPRFTFDKNDKVQNCTVQQIMGNNDPAHNWTAEGVQIKGQGTSSNEYGTSARNIDISCKKGFTDANGEPFKLYAMTDDSVGQNYFNIKVNVASSENANNACLAERYNAYQPFKRPAKEANPKVRDTMEFHPCVIYIQETGVDANGTAVPPQEFEADKKFHYYAAGDFGNSKKNSTAMGMTDNPLECIIEFSNNTSPQCLFQKGSGGVTIEDLQFDANDGVVGKTFWDGEVFEFRYPDVKDFTILEKEQSDFRTKRETSLREELTAQYLKEAESAGTSLTDEELTKKVDTEVATAERQTQLDTESAQDYADYVAGREQNKDYVRQMVANFREAWEWTESTNQATATNEALPSPVTYNNVTYNTDTIEYRKAKFTAEVSNYYVKDSLLFHYLFTERFTMIDNRAKNTFIHYNPEGSTAVKGKWDFVFDYDNDTALGCDNAGKLTMTYGLEDVDKFDTGAWVFNGAISGLWCNVRDCLNSELSSMALSLSDCWSGSSVIKMFNEYQEKKPEVLQMKDMWKKYLRPYEGYLKPTGTYVQVTDYIDKLNGRKKYQRARFETYQDAYFASKYNIGTASNDSISMRIEGAVGDSSIPFGDTFTLTPYCDLYVSMYFDGPTRTVRAKAGVPTEIKIPEGSYADKNVTVRSASWMQDLGDLSPFYLHNARFGVGKKLKNLKIGDSTSGYVNKYFDFLGVSSTNSLLEEIDLRGCYMTSDPVVNLSDIPSIKKLYTTNSQVSSVSFANGGMVDTADLNSISSLTIQNLYYLKNLSLSSYDNLTSLNYENCPNVDELALIQKTNNLKQVRLANINWTDDGDNYRGHLGSTAILNRLVAMGGINEAGNGVDQSVLTGKIKINGSILPSERRKYQEAWGASSTDESAPLYITSTEADGKEYHVIFLVEGEEVYSEYVESGKIATNPITAGYIQTPEKASDDMYDYTYSEWSYNLNNPIMDTTSGLDGDTLTIKALFKSSLRKFTVTWREGASADAQGILDSTIVEYGSDAVYTGSVPTKASDSVTNGNLTTYSKSYVFKNWDKSTANVKQDLIVYPVYEEGSFKGIDAVTDGLVDASTFNAADVVVYSKNAGDGGVLNRKTIKGLFSADKMIKVQMGYMPDFSNVNSEIIVGENSVYEQTSPILLTGENYVNIDGVKLFNEDKDFVLALDFTSAVKNASDYEETDSSPRYNTIMSIAANNRQLSTIIRLQENKAPIISVANDAQGKQISPFAPDTITYSSNSSIVKRYFEPRQIVVIRHKKGQNGLTVYYQTRNSEVETTTIDYPVTTISSNYSDSGICFGAQKGTNSYSAFGRGTINYSKIWYGDLGDDECKKIASWIYETRNFILGSYQGYYADDSCVNLTFVDTDLLDVTHVYHSNGAVGGFKYSTLRKFLNTTVYNGMSPTWRNALQLVDVKCQKGGSTTVPSSINKGTGQLFDGDEDTSTADNSLSYSSIISSKNYLFIPSAFEVASTSTSDYVNEVENSDAKFDAFTDDSTRIKKIVSYVDPTTKEALPWVWISRTPVPDNDSRVWGANYTGSFRSNNLAFTNDSGDYVFSTAQSDSVGILLCFSI